MRNGRVHRLLGGLGLGYLHTVGALLIGLWLTPFLLRQLGSHDYGLWLLGTQVVFYLGLMDLGVVALVPREVASASGLPTGDREDAIRALVGQTTRIVLWQVPAVALAGGVLLWLFPQEWAPLRGPFAIVVLVFVLAFPFRILLAVLQGLQDLAYVGTVQLTSWAAGSAVTIAGVVADVGLFSLALGWVTTQAVSAAMAWARLVRVFPDVVPARLPSLTLTALRQQIGRGSWVGVSQIAQVLLSGTDLVIIGKLLGPEAVVPYACTGKLITMLANQPQMFMQLALPALSELRASAPRQRLFEVSQSMTTVMLLGSGAIVAVVFSINRPFVNWWVGEGQFGGEVLTVVLLLGMVLRHVNQTATYALYCFGNERRLALTSIADGIVGVAATLLLVPSMGTSGAAVGSLAGTCLVSLPNNFPALAREHGTSTTSLLVPLGPWLIRLGLMVIGIAALMSFLTVQGVVGIGCLGLAVSAAYLLVMAPVIRSTPLIPIALSTIQPWLTTARSIAARHRQSVALGK